MADLSQLFRNSVQYFILPEVAFLKAKLVINQNTAAHVHRKLLVTHIVFQLTFHFYVLVGR